MHRSLSIELDLSSPTKRFSLAGLGFQWVIVLVLPTSPRRLKLREATSGRLSSRGVFGPSAWRGAALTDGSSVGGQQAAPANG
jgi:hypothetical protein